MSACTIQPVRTGLWITLCVTVLCGLPWPALAASPHVTVIDAWIRWLPDDLPAGGYLTLRNDGDQPARLTAVSSDAYGMIMLHRTIAQGATDRMEPVSEIVLPAHGTLSFAGTGYHLMLEHPRKSVKPGDRVPITLRFADGSTLAVICPVRSPADGGR